MKRIASKMKLRPGFEAEYKRRHDELWPELKTLLLSRGIKEYSIFLDEETLDLFAVFQVEEEDSLKTLPGQAVMQRWWAFMKDIMETNPDHSPLSIPLKKYFISQNKEHPFGEKKLYRSCGLTTTRLRQTTKAG